MIDGELNGLLRISTISPLSIPVFSTNGEISVISFPPRSSSLRFVRFLSGEISEMLLVERSRYSRFVRLANGEISETLLLLRESHLRVVKSESPEMSDILLKPRLRCSILSKFPDRDIVVISFPRSSNSLRLGRSTTHCQ